MSENNEINFKDFALENIFNPIEPPIDEPVDPSKDPVDPPVDNPIDEPADDPIDEPVDPDNDGDNKPITDDKEEIKGFYKAFNQKLGIDDEDIEDSILDSGMDGVFNYMENIVKNTIESEKEEILNTGDGLLGNLYEFIKNGGDVKNFVSTFLEPIDYSEVDIEGEDNINNQKSVLKELLKRQGDDEEDINEKIDNYDTSGILEKEAKLAQKKLIKLQEQDKVKLLKEQEQAKLRSIENEKQYWDNIKTTISTAKDLAGIELNDNTKKDFIKYLTEKDKSGLTQYQKDLQSDKEIALKLAFASYSKFDFSKIKDKARTEVTKDVKKVLSRFIDTNAQSQNKAKVNKDDKPSNKVDFKAFKLPIHN